MEKSRLTWYGGKKDGRGKIAESYGKFGSRMQRTYRKTSLEIDRQCKERCDEEPITCLPHQPAKISFSSAGWRPDEVLLRCFTESTAWGDRLSCLGDLKVPTKKLPQDHGSRPPT